MQAITNILTDVFKWIHMLVPSYGIDIILFTLLIKIVLLPFNIAQTRSTVKTQMIQPKLKEIQKKYKNDPKKLQEAQLELYKSEGVNPLAGCLPLIIQLPVLWAVFYVFRAYPFGSATFLGLTLSKVVKDANPVYIGLLFAIVSGATTYISTWLLTPKNQEPSAMSSSSTNFIMSAFFGWVSWTMPAGLVVYWIVNNIFQLVIQYSLNEAMYKKLKSK
ncbi:MAG: YidC/Oxa1 family membrane protein insertase [Clostridiales bacterium]|nr:YidC/Oxa1 family membrane protein insertase [Clostridiales bacterium]